jgi:hypothetical protein
MSGLADYLSPALSGYNVYRGATSGRPVAQARAGLGAAKLYGKLAGNYGIGAGATSALDILNIYQGLKQGGWEGDTKAGASALQLLGGPGGYIAGKSWKSGATGSDALSGAQTGAEIGSIIPGIGTVIGGLIGGAAGALSSAFGPGAKDPETYAVQNVIDATSKNKNNPAVAASVQNPYLELAGLMDRRSSTLPEYAQYGRMGEQKFTNDLVSQINNAAKTNPALAKDYNAMYNQVVNPWVTKMGSGYSQVGPEYTATNQGLIQAMTKQYMSGEAAQDWKSIGGQSPFASIYQNSPFTAVATPPTVIPGSMGNNKGRMQFAAKGGSMKNNSIKSKLNELYKGSFAGRQRHYDIGGYVDYPNYVTPIDSGPGSPWSFDETTPSDPYYTMPVDSGQGSPSSSYWGLSDPSAGATDAAYQAYIDAGGDPKSWGGSTSSDSGSSSTGSVFGQNGILSGLGSLLGVSSTGQLIQKYGALAPLIAAATGGNKSASAPGTPAGYGAIQPMPTPSNPRSYTQPNVANWYTYGEGPEKSFFSNNQLPSVPGVSPAQPSALPMPSQSSSMPIAYNPPDRQMRPMAQGGPAFDSTQGDSYVPDPGHGDGTSDGIDAKLSGGEYVMDAGTVSMLGNGSNEAGSRALDKLRQRVRKHAGQHLVKGKQFMKAKPAEAYLRGGKG